MTTTVWDKIYKDFQDGGPAWASLDNLIDNHFKEFVERTTFPKKWAFDIGYGTGDYLQYLKLHGFTAFGIDSSPTAHEMAEHNLGINIGLVVGDMYTYEFQKELYDLILSVDAIHHGTKDQISRSIAEIRTGLIDGGHAYITLPMLENLSEWNTFKDKTQIGPGTYTPNSGPEKGLPHSFFDKKEIERLFSGYTTVAIEIYDGRWHIVAQK